MSLVINTNLNALAAQNSAGMAAKAQSKAMQRLSTGLSINSAADDAAGLAISNRMTSNINGLGKAIKNANDGINMAQTADSALSNTTTILQRMRELAVQASSGTNSDANRQSIQAEVSQLKVQIDQIATTTNFNDINLLDGSAGKNQLQVGINQGQTMNMNFDSTMTKDIGIGSRASLTSIGKSTTAMSYGDLTINGVQVGPSVSSSDTLSSTGNAYSAISKAAAINAVTTQTGVVATVSGTYVNGAQMTTGSSSGSITVNGVTTASIVTTSDASISRQTVVNAINNISSQTGVTAIDTGDSVHGVQLFAADGRNISVILGGGGVATSAALSTSTTGLNVSNSVTLSGASFGTAPAATDFGTVSLKIGSSTLPAIALTAAQGTTPGALATEVAAKLNSQDATTNGTSQVGGGDFTVTSSGTASNFSLVVTSKSGRSIGALTLTTAAAGANIGSSTSAGSTFVGDYQLSSPSNSPITLGSAVSGTIANADLTAGTYVANTAQVVSAQRSVATTAQPVLGTTTQTTGQGILDGSSLKLNGVVIGAAVSTDDTSSDTTAVSSTKSASAIAIAAAINKSTNLTGVTAVAQANTIVGSSITNTAGLIGTDIYLNGVDIANTLNAGYKSADVAKLLNQYTGQTGVVAQDNGLGVTLTAADGRNISIGVQGTNGVAGLGLATGSVASNLTVGLTGAGASYANQAATTYARVALQSNKQFTVQSGNAGDINLNLLGFSTGTFGGANNGLKIAAVDVSTQAGAQNAITAIDAALVTVSANQSRAGAFINRLNNVVTNQTSMQSNMTTSRSAIQDTDYSAETTNLAKSQIISQAATAMLAQANQSSQNVLALLK